MTETHVYVATEEALFVHEKGSNESERLSKVSGLSDINISAIAKDEQTNTIIIAYENANIDLIEGSSIYNLSDIKRKSIIGEKKLNNIYTKDGMAYLSSSFGLISIDLEKKEVKDSYSITQDGADVYDACILNDTLYTVGPLGLFAGELSDNLVDFHNWSNALQDSSIQEIEAGNKELYFLIDGAAYERSSNGLLPLSNNALLNSLHYQEETLYAFSWARLWRLDNQNWSQLKKHDLMSYATDIQVDGDAFWISDLKNGLLELKDGRFLQHHPEGPYNSESFYVHHQGNTLWVSPGGINLGWNNNKNRNGFYFLEGAKWSHIPSASIDNIYDITSIKIDPFQKNDLYLSSWNWGLIHLEMFEGNWVFKQRYDHHNTNNVLQSLSYDQNSGSYGWIRLKDLIFDDYGNLWMSNTQVEKPLVVKTAQGDWYSYKPSSYAGNGVNSGDLVIDNEQQKWMLLAKGTGILVYNDNNTLDNPYDDQDKLLSTATGNGGLPSKDVYSIAKDLDGEIWVGTNKGIAVFYSPENVFSNNDFDAQQILVEVDGYVEHLLSNETVTAIAVDGANRKWLGTQSAGVYLVSDDGSEQIHHFTEENSPLFSNRIMDISINENNGTVYFATDKGLLSYRSDATSGVEQQADIKIYPNPVREDYTGLIGMRELVPDAQVKITDLNGNLVYQTQAEGGQAVWDGKNGNGERVQTGVYLVYSTNINGTETAVGKILFIH
jgi:hypothetical protein